LAIGEKSRSLFTGIVTAIGIGIDKRTSLGTRAEEEKMRALSGCTRCGHVERRRAEESAPERCPECDSTLRPVSLLGARLLVREQRAARLHPEISASLLEQARRARSLL
jgi:hypothetical protein